MIKTVRTHAERSEPRVVNGVTWTPMTQKEVDAEFDARVARDRAARRDRITVRKAAEVLTLAGAGR